MFARRRVLHLVNRQWPVSGNVSPNIITNDLFTDAFLAVDVFAARRSEALKCGKISNDPLTGAIRKEIYISEDVDSLNRTVGKLKSFMNENEDTCNQSSKVGLLRDFVNMCHLVRAPEPAKRLMEDQKLMSKVGIFDPYETEKNRLAPKVPALLICYLDILFKDGQYQQLLSEVEKLVQSVENVPHNIFVIYLMACLQEDTADCLVRATRTLTEKSPETLVKSNKVAHAYALLVLRHGNDPGLALTVATSTQYGKRSNVRNLLTSYILSELNRPAEACACLEDIVNNHDKAMDEATPDETKFQTTEQAAAITETTSKLKSQRKTLKVPSQGVESLTETVLRQEDAQLTKRLDIALSRLSEFSVVIEQSMNDFIGSEIGEDKIMQYKRQLNKKRSERRQNSEIHNDMQPQEQSSPS